MHATVHIKLLQQQCSLGHLADLCQIETRGGLGRLAASHLPGGPVSPLARWAATSNVEVGQTLYPINRGSLEG